MKENWQAALSAVLQHEGGFVNDPDDPGGMTNLGCTKTTWEEWVGHPVTEKVMRSLTSFDVEPLYKRRYWEKVQGDALPSGIDYCCFDTAINSGPGRAIKLLQGCLGVAVDGSLGPKTLAAVNASNQAVLIQSYCEARLSFLQDLPTWKVFGKGWGRRVTEVQQTALKMAK